jgi:serine protease inhibitor ecotin
MPWFPKGDWKRCTKMNNGQLCKGHPLGGKNATHHKVWGVWYYSIDGVKPPAKNTGPGRRGGTKKGWWQ